MAADLFRARAALTHDDGRIQVRVRDDASDRRRDRLRRAVPWTLAAALFALYAALAVRDQQRMETTGYDLGIFDQAVRAYAHGHLPISTLKGPHFDLLGDHFSPIIATLAPLYLLWPSAFTLLLAQAALLAVGVVPLSRWATIELGARAGLAAGIIYGLSWGIASAAGFDFHEVAFGVPLLAFSATALGRRRLPAAVFWALPLLLVKEDLGFTVAVIGVSAAVRGAKLLGLAAAVIGISGSVLEIEVLIPAANHAGYMYTNSLFSSGPVHDGTMAHMFYDAAHLFVPHTKIITVIQLLAPTAFLAARSALIWLTVPTLAWRFMSDVPAHWGTMFQYSAVLMPIVVAALIEALIRRRDRPRAPTRPWWRNASLPPLAVGLVVTAVLLPSYPFARLAHPGEWSTPARIAVARSVLQRIPDGADVTASNTLIPQLTDRATVYLFDPGTLGRVTWIVLDTQSYDPFPLTRDAFSRLITAAERSGFQIVENFDGFLLLHR
jgi:uncharacterized membrane protein